MILSIGSAGGTRTHTEQSLNLLPLPFGLQRHGYLSDVEVFLSISDIIAYAFGPNWIH